MHSTLFTQNKKNTGLDQVTLLLNVSKENCNINEINSEGFPDILLNFGIEPNLFSLSKYAVSDKKKGRGLRQIKI